MKTEIEWKDALATPPDDDTTVLCGFAETGDVEMGYLDAEIWRSTEGAPFATRPDLWAHIPALPERNEEGVPA